MKVFKMNESVDTLLRPSKAREEWQLSGPTKNRKLKLFSDTQ